MKRHAVTTNGKRSFFTRRSSLLYLISIMALFMGCRAGAPVKASKIDTKAAKSISVAPVFVHGEGFGTRGCFHNLPLGSISEETARNYIQRQFEKNGVVFDKFDVRVSDVMIKQKQGLPREGRVDKIVGLEALNIDAYSTEYNLGYEYVSSDDHLILGGLDSRYYSTTIEFDVRNVAEDLSKMMTEYNRMNFVVFYDPMFDPLELPHHRRVFPDHKAIKENLDISVMLKQNQGKEIEMLVAQVADSIDWLRQQGIIRK